MRRMIPLCAVLLAAAGCSWEGYPSKTLEQKVSDLKNWIDDHRNELDAAVREDRGVMARSSEPVRQNIGKVLAEIAKGKDELFRKFQEVVKNPGDHFEKVGDEWKESSLCQEIRAGWLELIEKAEKARESA